MTDIPHSPAVGYYLHLYCDRIMKYQLPVVNLLSMFVRQNGTFDMHNLFYTTPKRNISAF